MTDCNFCKKKGLPIFPVCAAIIPNELNAPLLPSSFIMEFEPEGMINYTARQLRSGYIYIYDERESKENILTEYYVTTKGYCSLVPNGPWHPSIAENKEVCVSENVDHRGKASLITISVEKEGCVYISWSENRWTEFTRNKHINNEDECCYKHMQKINVSAWLTNQVAENAVSLSSLNSTVAEFSSALKGKENDINDYSIHSFIGRDNAEAKSILDSANEMLDNKGMILLLSDPVIIASDLSNLMLKRVRDNFLENDKYKRELVLSTTIDQLKNAMIDMSRNEYLDHVNSAVKSSSQYDTDYGIVSSDVATNTMETPEGYKRYSERYWEIHYEKDGKHFFSKKKEAFDNEFRKALAEYDNSVIYPMSELYVLIMESSSMQHYIQYNYDRANEEDGLNFLEMFTLCLAGDEQFQPCAILIEKWMKGNVDDKNNHLLRALTLNQEKIKLAFNTLSEQGKIDASKLPWSNIFDLFKPALEINNRYLAEKIGAITALLINKMTRTIAKILELNNSEILVHQSLIALAGLTGNPLMRIEMENVPRESVIRKIFSDIDRHSPLPTDKNLVKKIDRSISKRMAELGIHGRAVTGNRYLSYYLFLDIRHMDIYQNMPIDKVQAEIAKTIKTPEHMTKLEQRMRKVVATRNTINYGGLATGSIVLIAQFCSVVSSLKENNELFLDKKNEAIRRIIANAATAFAGTATLIGGALTSVKIINVIFGSRTTSIGLKLKVWGGRAAGILGLYLAVEDVMSGTKSIQKGKIGLGILYYTQAGLGAFAGILVLLSVKVLISGVPATGLTAYLLSGSIALMLGLVTILIAIIILASQNNPIQDWLERTLWGITPQYNDENEISEFNKILNDILKKTEDESTKDVNGISGGEFGGG